MGGVGGPGKPGGGASASTRPANNNLYNQGTNKNRNAPSSMQRDAGLNKANSVGKGKNNVYADRNGNVSRQTSSGWQSRSNNGGWSSPSKGGSNMNRDAQARSRGSSSSYGGSRGGGSRGGSRGGGGRR